MDHRSKPQPRRGGARMRGMFAVAALAAAPLKVAAAAPTIAASGQALTPTAAAGAIFTTLEAPVAGQPATRPDGAISIAVSPDRRTLLVLTSGYNAPGEDILVFDISRRAPRQRQALRIPTAYAGIAFAPDGHRFYVGTGGGDSVLTYALGNAGWAASGPAIRLGHSNGIGNRQGPSTAGLAVSPDGTTLLVANAYNDSISRIDLARGALAAELDLRPGIAGPARAGVAGGETPFWVAVDARGTAYVSSQRDREIDVIAGTVPKVIARIPVRGTPNRMILNRAGTLLFVAADNDDSVQVIRTATRTVIARIDVAAPAGLLRPGPRYRGAAPNALALSADEKTLYVSDGGENAIAVVDVGDLDHAATRALLPTGFYPQAVAVAGGWIYVANAKSVPGPNPGNCQDHVAQSRPQPPPYAKRCETGQYVLQIEPAGLLAEPLPQHSALDGLTRQVAGNDGYLSAPDAHDAAVMAALHRRIKHIIYIVKENRTYDQILGDLGRGNGDPAIVEFGGAITPNFHAMARNFVDLDNFYDSGSVSGDGWPWSTEGRESDFNVKTIPLEYSRRPTHAPYDAESQVRDVDVGQGGLDARRRAQPTIPDDPNLLPGIASDDSADGPEDTAGPAHTQHGFLWDAALKAGLSVRNYGFLCDLDRYPAHPMNFGRADTQIPEDRHPFSDKVVQAYPLNPTLVSRTDRYFRGFDNAYPDYWRVQEWGREFSAFEANGGLPALTLLRLMHDHMGSFSTAIDGVDTPELQQADNDYAVGLVAQRVAHSRYAGNTLIFVIEDDAQDGPDHVDAHRSTAYVLGPYVKHGAVIGARYSTVNMLRTIEDILGTEHLSLYDAYQPPMTEIFDLNQAAWSFEARPSSYLFGAALPLPKQAIGPVPLSTHAAAWWTARTQGYDWSHEDHVPALLFNQLVWRGLVPDRPYPGARGFDRGDFTGK